MFISSIDLVYLLVYSAHIFFALGFSSLSLSAYYFPNWRDLAKFQAVLGLGFIPFWFLLPESPRWLFQCGKLTKSIEILSKICGNRVELNEVDSDFKPER